MTDPLKLVLTSLGATACSLEFFYQLAGLVVNSIMEVSGKSMVCGWKDCLCLFMYYKDRNLKWVAELGFASI